MTYDPITLQVGLGLAPPIYQWIQEAWDRPGLTHTGQMGAVDVNGDVSSSLEFRDARLVETRFPTLLASSRDPGVITLKLAPDFSQAGGELAPPHGDPGRQRRWIVSNFRLTIEGLDATRVQRIEPIVVKTPADAQSAPAVDFPSLVVTFAKSRDTSWSDWFYDFVIRGNNSDSDERSGQLELLDANLRPIATLSFEHIGIRRLATTPPESAPNPEIASYTAEMYVENIRWHVENQN